MISSFILYTMYLFVCCPSIPFELGFYITIFFMEMVMLLCMYWDSKTLYGDMPKETRKERYLRKLLYDEPLQAGLKTGVDVNIFRIHANAQKFVGIPKKPVPPNHIIYWQDPKDQK